MYAPMTSSSEGGPVVHHLRKAFWVLVCVLATTLNTGVASAEIYKWVDEEGNIHFGDKPLDPADAATAESVELQESYSPAERTALEQEAYTNQQEASRRRYEATLAADKRAREEAAALEKERVAQFCVASEARLQRLSTMQIAPDGRRVRYFAVEDGKSVTAQRQREIIEEIKSEMSVAGCSN